MHFGSIFFSGFCYQNNYFSRNDRLDFSTKWNYEIKLLWLNQNLHVSFHKISVVYLFHSKDLVKKKGSCQCLSCWQNWDVCSKLPFLMCEEPQKTSNWKCRDLLGCRGSPENRLRMGWYSGQKFFFLLLLTIYSGCFVYFSGFLIAFYSSLFPSLYFYSFDITPIWKHCNM